MRGRPDDWQAALQDAPLPTVVGRARELGFRGVYVDRYGYGDGGAAVETELEKLLGRRPMVSADERLTFFPVDRSGS
jgi:phosphoglycerol transferase